MMVISFKKLREAFDRLLDIRPWARPSPELVAALLWIEHDMQSLSPLGAYRNKLGPRSEPSVPLKCWISHFALYDDLRDSMRWLEEEMSVEDPSAGSEAFFGDLEEQHPLV